MASNSNETSTVDNNNTMINTEVIQLWAMILVNIVSILCSFFHFYHLMSKRPLREALNNHPMIVLICTIFFIQLIDVPFYINYLRLGYVWPETSLFCIIWWNIDTVSFEITLFVIAEASLSRYILIFHEKLLSTRKKRLFFHYIPLMIFILYPIVFYLLVETLITYAQPYPYDYTQPWCDYDPAYMYNSIFHKWQLVVNQIGPTLISLISDVVLILRVIHHKHIRLRQPIVWKKHRKMTIQLLSISIFCSSFNTPILIYNLLWFFKLLPSMDYNYNLQTIFYFVSYFSMLFLPCVMILSLPKKYWWEKWWIKFFGRQQRQRQITPMMIPKQKTIEQPKNKI
ncbi:unnamed protein product [Rotaria sp. Silwood1]|nr:unnamed protein product [Rotaria sp. Silwood1]